MDSIGTAMIILALFAGMALFKGDPSLLDALINYLNAGAACAQ